MSDKELTEELHKPIIRKFKKRTRLYIYVFAIDNIQGADLADIQLIDKFDKGIRILLCVIDIFSKYTWVISLKDKKCITTTNAFQKKKNQMNVIGNQIKYGQIKAVNFTIAQ